jgi:serine/threonine-protein kinase RsbW
MWKLRDGFRQEDTLHSAQQVAMSSPIPIKYPADVLIASDLDEARRVQTEIETLLHTQTHFSETEIFSIKMALEEAIVNAIKHGNQMDPNKRVRIAYRVTSDQFDVMICDEGPGFNPEDVPDPTAPENLERPCGRGLLLMRHYMNRIEYHGTGNTVIMSKSCANGKC